MSIASLAVAVTLATTASAQAVQTLGQWQIASAPTSATLISGGGSLWNWLNTTNAALTVNQAMTAFPVGDTGYADASPGTIVDLTYAPGQAVNNPGLDLVLLDSGFSANSYTLYSSTDGFTTPLTIPAANLVTTSELRNYYAGSLPNQGPFPAFILSYGIDLSFWGIPQGGDVTTIRMVMSGIECDPLTVAVLDPVPAPNAAALLAIGALATTCRRRNDV